MKNITVVIVDNDEESLKQLGSQLTVYFPNLTVVATCINAEEAFPMIHLLVPDIVFFNIDLTGERTLSYLEQFNKRSFEIVFTSKSTKHAVTAFKANALDYLLKPFNCEEVKRAVEKTGTTQINPTTYQPEDIRIKIHRRDKVEQVNSAQIIYLEAKNNYTIIATQDGRKHMVSKVLRSMEGLLSANSNFIRIHRSVIINTRFIKDYSKTPPYTVTLVNNIPFEISRRKKTEILELLRSI